MTYGDGPAQRSHVLTVVRILLVPVLVAALLEKTGNGDLLAAIVFAIASLTDAIDGYLARSRNWVTTFGKLMDPIADKLLIVAALIALVSLGRLEAWVATVHGRPRWVTVLVYLTVVVTVLSGADYFFGLRRHLNAPSTRADRGGLAGGGAERRAKA